LPTSALSPFFNSRSSAARIAALAAAFLPHLVVVAADDVAPPGERHRSLAACLRINSTISWGA